MYKRQIRQEIRKKSSRARQWKLIPDLECLSLGFGVAHDQCSLLDVQRILLVSGYIN